MTLLPYTITHSSEFNFEGKSAVRGAPTLQVFINDFHEDGNWEIEFRVDGEYRTTGGGRAHQIFATVIAIIKDWWKEMSHNFTYYPVKSIEFSASKENAGGRERLYQRFGKQFAAAIGFRLTKKSIHAGSTTNFLLVNPKKKDEPGYEPVPENFADGKNKVNEADVTLGKYLFHVAYASGLTGMLRDGHLGEPDEYFSMTSDQKYIVSGSPEVQIVIDTAKVSKMETFEQSRRNNTVGLCSSSKNLKIQGY